MNVYTRFSNTIDGVVLNNLNRVLSCHIHTHTYQRKHTTLARVSQTNLNFTVIKKLSENYTNSHSKINTFYRQTKISQLMEIQNALLMHSGQLEIAFKWAWELPDNHPRVNGKLIELD